MSTYSGDEDTNSDLGQLLAYKYLPLSESHISWQNYSITKSTFEPLGLSLLLLDPSRNNGGSQPVRHTYVLPRFQVPGGSPD